MGTTEEGLEDSARTGRTRSWSGAIAAGTRGEMNMLWPLVTGYRPLVIGALTVGSGRAVWVEGRWASIANMISLRLPHCALRRTDYPVGTGWEISTPGSEALFTWSSSSSSSPATGT